MQNKKKILIFGLNNTGQKIYTRLRREKKYLLKLITKKKYSQKKIYSFNPDLIFSLGYRQKIESDVLNCAKIGAYNMHKSLLPLHSGANPIFYTILKNTEAGHTIHEMNEKIDSGNIVFQKKIKYDFSFDAKKLYNLIEKHQVNDFFIFLKKIGKKSIKTKKNKFNFKNYNFLKNFKSFKEINFFRKNKYFKTINLLRALNFKPFTNAVIKIDKKYFSINIEIKEIKKLKKKKYNKIKEY